MSQGRPLYLEVGAIKMKGMGHIPRESPLYLEVGAMKMKGVGHIPRETLVDEKKVDNVPKSDLMKVVAPTEPSTPAQE